MTNPLPQHPDTEAVHANLARGMFSQVNKIIIEKNLLSRHVLDAREEGMSWAQIGAATGTSRQAAWQRWSDDDDNHPRWEDVPIPGL